MTEPRQLATVRSYEELHAAMRARAAELEVTRETIDAVSGLQSGYAGKVLAPKPMKRLGPTTLPLMLGALGLALVVVEDEIALAKVAPQLTKRRRPVAMLAVKSGRGKQRLMSVRFLRKIAGRGGNMRARKLPQRRRSQIARNAAKARWAKRATRAPGKTATTSPTSREPKRRPQCAGTAAAIVRALPRSPCRTV